MRVIEVASLDLPLVGGFNGSLAQAGSLQDRIAGSDKKFETEPP
jgi:hypothetical protein